MKKPNTTRILAATKGLVIPKEGWNAHNFRRYGRAMIAAMHRIAQIEQRRLLPIVVRECRTNFRDQLDEIIKRFEARRGHLAGRRSASKAADLSVFTSAHEALMVDIINQVLEETKTDARAVIINSVRSAMGQGYSKTATLLAQKVEVARNTALQRRANGLASKITHIGETTRKRFHTLLEKAADSGLSVVETVKLIRVKIPQINDRRALTIARTELGNAWREGAHQAFKESETITHVSVIGCESREEELWDTPSYQQYMYAGESTCNAEDVPILDIDKLNFHPNHTGTSVPSRFRED